MILSPKMLYMMKNRLITLVALLVASVAHLSAERFCAVSNEGRKIYYATLSDTECEVICDYTGQTTFAGDVVIPDTVSHDGKEYAVVSIGQEAFWYCRRLLRVSLPSTLRNIDVSAFANCSQLFDLELPEGLETIGQKAFKECRNLQTIGLPSTLRTIDRQAFCDCKMLNNVHLPASVTEVGEDAFKGCDHLTTVRMASTEPPSIDYNAFNADTYYGSNHTIHITLEVPTGALAVYKGTSPWCDFEWIKEYDVEQDIQEVEATSLQIYAVDGSVVIEGAYTVSQASFYTPLGQCLGVIKINDGRATFEADVSIPKKS